jgi:hypothetical protein
MQELGEGQTMDTAQHTDRAEVILSLLAEGGSLTLCGIKSANG